MSASNSHLLKAMYKSTGWGATEHVCSKPVCELREAMKLKFTEDVIKGERLVCFNSEGQMRSTYADMHFLLLHFRLRLQTVWGGWVYLATCLFFFFPVQIASLKTSAFAENWHCHFTLTLCRKITPRGNWLWSLMECPLKMGKKKKREKYNQALRVEKIKCWRSSSHAYAEYVHKRMLMGLNAAVLCCRELESSQRKGYMLI